MINVTTVKIEFVERLLNKKYNIKDDRILDE